MNVHQVKVNEHDESEWNTHSRSISGLLHRANTFVLISISYIIHLLNFSNVQKLPYFHNAAYSVMTYIL